MSLEALPMLCAALAHAVPVLVARWINAAERRRRPARIDPNRLRPDRANWRRT